MFSEQNSLEQMQDRSTDGSASINLLSIVFESTDGSSSGPGSDQAYGSTPRGTTKRDRREREFATIQAERRNLCKRDLGRLGNWLSNRFDDLAQANYESVGDNKPNQITLADLAAVYSAGKWSSTGEPLSLEDRLFLKQTKAHFQQISAGGLFLDLDRIDVDSMSSLIRPTLDSKLDIYISQYADRNVRSNGGAALTETPEKWIFQIGGSKGLSTLTIYKRDSEEWKSGRAGEIQIGAADFQTSLRKNDDGSLQFTDANDNVVSLRFCESTKSFSFDGTEMAVNFSAKDARIEGKLDQFVVEQDSSGSKLQDQDGLFDIVKSSDGTLLVRHASGSEILYPSTVRASTDLKGNVLITVDENDDFPEIMLSAQGKLSVRHDGKVTEAEKTECGMYVVKIEPATTISLMPNGDVLYANKLEGKQVLTFHKDGRMTVAADKPLITYVPPKPLAPIN